MGIPFVKELRRILLALVVLASVIHLSLGILWAFPVYVSLAALCFIARRLPRKLEAAPLIVCAPVDGVVINIQRDLPHPHLEETALRIRIRQHSWGEFVLHSPIEGKVLERWWPDKDGSGNKNFGFVIQADEGDRCVVDVVNAMRPRFKTHLIPAGYRSRQGQRCGLVGIGVIVDVYVVEGNLVKVVSGDHVRAGCDVIASFQPHHLTAKSRQG